MRSIIVFLALLVVASDLYAADLTFEGKGDYRVNGSRTQVTVNFDRLTNRSPNSSSGVIYLQLWASPDNDPAGPGYELTDPVGPDNFSGVTGGTLRPNSSLTDISFSAAYNPPEEGTYYVFLLAMEYPNLDSIVASVPATDNPQFLVNPGTGGDSTTPPRHSGGGSGQQVVELVCEPCEYTINDEFVELYVTSVRNTRTSGSSGTLKLELWATDRPYEGTSMPGYVVADFRLGQLDAQKHIPDIRRSLAISPPPDGTYYMNLILKEYDGDFEIIDYISFEGTQSFLAPTPAGGIDNGGTGSGGVPSSGSGGGGGSFGLLELCVLSSLGLLAFARRPSCKLLKTSLAATS